MIKKYILIGLLTLSILIVTGCETTSPKSQSPLTTTAADASQVPSPTTAPAPENSPVAKVNKAEVFVKLNAKVSAGILFDHDGNMFVGTDVGILRITPEAEVSTFCSFKGLGGQRFFFASPLAWDMVMDMEGNIIAAAQDRILKISPTGESTTLIKDNFVNGFLGASGLEIDREGNLYVTCGSSILRYTPDMEKTEFLDVSGMGDMSLFSLRFDPAYQNLYASEFNTRSLMRIPINSDGSAGTPEVLITSPIPTSGSPLNMVFSDSGNLYCSLDCRWTLLKMSPDGEFNLIDMPRAGENHLIAFGGKGFDEESIYFTTYAGKEIYKFHVGEKAFTQSPPND